MANFVFNISKGRVAELYDRVESDDPANSALIIVPLETSGLESDATLIDKDTLADVLAGTTNEQTTLGRKTLTQADLAAIPAPDDTNDRNERSLPNILYTATAGNAVSAWLVCYDADTTAGNDSNIVPLTKFDRALTPDGNDFQLNAGVFFRAS